MRIGIIGQGFVGNAIYQKFKKLKQAKFYITAPLNNLSTDHILFKEPLNLESTC